MDERESVLTSTRDGETVRNTFRGIVEAQLLLDERLFDGMEVSSWMYGGDRLMLEEGRVCNCETRAPLARA